jgi:hypothetical protein
MSSRLQQATVQVTTETYQEVRALAFSSHFPAHTDMDWIVFSSPA